MGRNSKLTEQQVIEARRSHKYGSFTHGTAALARRYGVTQMAMWNAIHGKTWAHVPGAIAPYVTGSQAFSSDKKINEDRKTPVRTIEKLYQGFFETMGEEMGRAIDSSKAVSGLVPEGDVRLTANIRQDLHLKLKIAAATRRTTIGELLEELIESHLAESDDSVASSQTASQERDSIEDLKLDMDKALIDGDEERFDAAQTAYLDARATSASE